ncbi:MAG TPA: alternative ribosome rescue aminoacyl-tRNA hydrolase ArfB [Gemmatimonadaceae bacterium]|nr:alternative ribosome rescue aminoacyl-tRNA hydrolase ArfB [Gemmatimonadaceae bacterium]
MASITETHLVVNRGLSIPLAEIELRASRSSGPGGQHANKTESRIEAVYDIMKSTAPTDSQRSKILKKLGPVVRATAQDERSQLRNRELALTRLGQRLAEALIVRRNRVATKPSRAAKQRRVAEKRARSETKTARRRPSADD